MSFRQTDLDKPLNDDLDKKAPEIMVKCHVCGVNQPVSESIISQGKYYCSNAHWERHKENESTKNND